MVSGVMYEERLLFFQAPLPPNSAPSLLPLNELPTGHMSRDAEIDKDLVLLDAADIALPQERALLLMTNTWYISQAEVNGERSLSLLT